MAGSSVAACVETAEMFETIEVSRNPVALLGDSGIGGIKTSRLRLDGITACTFIWTTDSRKQLLLRALSASTASAYSPSNKAGAVVMPWPCPAVMENAMVAQARQQHVDLDRQSSSGTSQRLLLPPQKKITLVCTRSQNPSKIIGYLTPFGPHHLLGPAPAAQSSPITHLHAYCFDSHRTFRVRARRPMN